MGVVGHLSQLCEDIRDAVDEQGARKCFEKSLLQFHKESGLPIDGLWAVVHGVIQGYSPEKLLKRLHKSWGGQPEQWAKWFAIAKTKPDC